MTTSLPQSAQGSKLVHQRGALIISSSVVSSFKKGATADCHWMKHSRCQWGATIRRAVKEMHLSRSLAYLFICIAAVTHSTASSPRARPSETWDGLRIGSLLGIRGTPSFLGDVGHHSIAMTITRRNHGKPLRHLERSSESAAHLIASSRGFLS